MFSSPSSLMSYEYIYSTLMSLVTTNHNGLKTITNKFSKVTTHLTR